MQEQSDIISRDIPWEKWNLLSSVEISVLKSLNFNLLPEKKKKEKRIKFAALGPQHATAPAPHLTDVAVTCRFCKAKFSVYFDMTKVGNALRGKRISEEHFAHLVFTDGAKAEVITENAITCEHCYDYLAQKEKDDLIKLILHQQVKIKTRRSAGHEEYSYRMATQSI